MFWSNMATSSNIDSLLEEQDVTLTTILEQAEVLQECKAGNRKLLEFLQQCENMMGMLEMITQQPLEDLPMAKQYQHPNVACEILSSDNGFSEKITDDRDYLAMLFRFFGDSPPPLNPLLASYVSRVLSHIVVRESQNWYAYQRNGTHFISFLDDSPDDIVGWLLKHIGTSAVCDLLFNMIMKLEDMRDQLIQWLERGQFVERLMLQLGSTDPDMHEGVSRLVGKLLSEYQTLQLDKLDTDKIYDALKLPSTIATVLHVIFDKEEICQSSIINGLNVVVALIGITNSQVQPKQMSWVPIDGSNKDLILDPQVESLILSRFEDMYKFLMKEPKEELILTSGVVPHRMGRGRLAVLKFYAQILSLRRSVYIDKIIEVGALGYIMDMFWANNHNSFLHRLVENIITQIILTPEENKGLDFLIYEQKLLENILEKFSDKKCGYRCHIGRMATAFYDTTHKPGFQEGFYKRFEKESTKLADDFEVFTWNELEDYNYRQKKFLGVVNPLRRNNQRSLDQSPIADMSSTWGDQSAFQADFPTDYGVFSASDTFVEDGMVGKKDMFEMFCCERNGLNDDDFALSDDEKFDAADQDFSFSNPDVDFSFQNAEADVDFAFGNDEESKEAEVKPDFNLISSRKEFEVPPAEPNFTMASDPKVNNPEPELSLS